VRRNISVTMHCVRGNASLQLVAGGPPIVVFTTTPDKTGSLAGPKISGVNIHCLSDSPKECECFWRVDSIPTQ